jgi:CelD/BcsL family acetyltransferase involved in cellulose biosynthesis
MYGCSQVTCSFPALIPALGASPAWLEPQRRYLGVEVRTIVREGQTAGIFPMTLDRWRYGLPVPVCRSITSPLSFAGTPLIHHDHAAEVFSAFLCHPGARAFLFESVPAAGPFWEQLVASAVKLEAPLRLIHRWERATLEAEGDFESWFEASVERKRRKEFRRLRSRLAEQGELASLSLPAGGDVKAWIGEFAELESRGWKGRRGTAVAAQHNVLSTLTECLMNIHAEGRLRFWKLSLGGRPAAMMFAMVESGTAWLGKIAFDESLAKYSPGVLLVLDATRDLLSDPGIRLVDSCAVPGHPMIDHLWRDRLPFCDVMVGHPGMSPAAFAMIFNAERLRRTGRSLLKGIYHRILQRP